MAFTKALGSMLSIELISSSDTLISISRRTTISSNSIKLASGPLAPLDDPGPNKAAHTFFTSLSLPDLAGNSAFLFVPLCTCTSTNDYCKFGTSVLPQLSP
ncbi:hypothetical protein DEO72_LG3g1142 [Vigna unguiculata]|uniref:Uncharacterized protein n=1 Tax=Vigna unguiculata TaxID=3917 RepID=A0A4D6LDM5_VIGUN|nr:hypothetical protein DEO72_LG3g1142 [Vigna unguiculata]